VDDAEIEQLLFFQEAVAQTQRYLDDANHQLAEAIRRTTLAREEADSVEADARAEVKAARKDAEVTAAQIVRSAEDRAREIIEEADERTRKLVSDAEERLSQIKIEREAVAGYFESLRGVLTQAEQVTAENA
jgi:cell division septum initiation protein DivIVA